MAQLRQSNGTPIDTITQYTARRIFEKGHATISTPGATGFDVVDLISAQDAPYLAATPSAPILLGVDNVQFLPLQFPEA